MGIFDIKLLSNKKTTISQSGEEIIDMFDVAMELVVDPVIIDKVVVTEAFEMRPDIISKIQYGDENYLDLILFFNNIQNPLDIKKGMVLLIPDKDSLERIKRKERKKESDKNNTRISFIEKLEKKDVERLKEKISKEKGIPKDIAVNEIRPTNVKPDNVDNIKPKDGTIILGTDVSNCKDPETEQQKLSYKIRLAIKEKIKDVSKTKIEKRKVVVQKASTTLNKNGNIGNIEGKSFI